MSLNLIFLFIFKYAAATESLDIKFKVGSALVEIVKRITTKPRYVIAKVLHV